MDDKQINLLLIDNDESQIELIKQSLKEPKEAIYNLDVAGTLEKGIERMNGGGINTVIVGFQLFAGSINGAVGAIKAAAPGIPVLIIVNEIDEDKLVGPTGEIIGDYIVKEHLSGYVLST